MYIRGQIPWNFAELAKVVTIDINQYMLVLLLITLANSLDPHQNSQNVILVLDQNCMPGSRKKCQSRSQLIRRHAREKNNQIQFPWPANNGPTVNAGLVAL